MHTNKFNFYAAAQELARNMSSEPSIYNRFCTYALDESASFPERDRVYQQYISRFIYPTNHTTEDFAFYTEDYLKRFRYDASPEAFITFTRFLSLFISGRIPDQLFIRLILQYVFPKGQRETWYYNELPNFLSALSESPLFRVFTKFENESQELAAEIILGVTVTIKSSMVAASLSKMFKLLANGLIDKATAAEWLRPYCHTEVLEKLERIEDTTYLHPSVIPSDFILCPNFKTTEEPMDLIGSFSKLPKKQSKKSFLVDVYEAKLMGLRKLIRQLADRTDIGLQQFQQLYGEMASEMKALYPLHSPLMIKQLTAIYNSTQADFMKVIDLKLSALQVTSPEYRKLFKTRVNHPNFAFHYMCPGIRHIHFDSQRAMRVATAVVRTFIESMLTDDSKIKSLNSLSLLMKVFKEEEKHFVSYEKPIFSMIYLAEVARILHSCLDVNEVLLVEDDLPAILGEEEQKSDVTKALARYAMGDYSKAVDTQIVHIDLVLTRCVRALSAFDPDDSLPEFPAEIDDSFIYSTMHFKDGDVVVSSVFSPSFSEMSSEVTSDGESVGDSP